jgi:hypothetical protein
MAQPPEKAHYRMVARKILAGAVVPFLGAGVNLYGRPHAVSWQRGRYLPSGAELATYLAGENDYPFDDPTDLLRVSQYVDVMVGHGPLYEELRSVFDADYAPTPVHRLLASLPSLIRAHKSDKTGFSRFMSRQTMTISWKGHSKMPERNTTWLPTLPMVTSEENSDTLPQMVSHTL